VAPLLRHQMILHINIEDVAITRAIVQAGQLLDVLCLDHLVIGRGCFVSLKSKGLGFC
jgi:DNA repair protein RadC